MAIFEIYDSWTYHRQDFWLVPCRQRHSLSLEKVEVSYLWPSIWAFLTWVDFSRMILIRKWFRKSVLGQVPAAHGRWQEYWHAEWRTSVLGVYKRLPNTEFRHCSEFDLSDGLEFFAYLHRNLEILQTRKCPNFPNLVKNLVKIGQFYSNISELSAHFE